uniref:Uncharacterized protein n=1 Tax=Chelonoidis abingdonii TaxID=106734 RepID=A0A8C0J6E4_CHEAB
VTLLSECVQTFSSSLMCLWFSFPAPSITPRPLPQQSSRAWSLSYLYTHTLALPCVLLHMLSPYSFIALLVGCVHLSYASVTLTGPLLQASLSFSEFLVRKLCDPVQTCIRMLLQLRAIIHLLHSLGGM